MAYTVPTLEEMHELLIALAKVLFPEHDVSRLSMLWKLSRVNAGAATDVHAHVDSALRDIMPDTAEGAALDRWATLLGLTRKAATPARKSDALRVYGTVAATVAVGDELTHVSGLVFQINEDATIPAAGYIDVDIVAVDTGSATRLAAAETLTFVSAPAGIEEIAELQSAIDEDGDDAELDGALRLRVLERLSVPPLGGAQGDYVAWAKEITGIAAAYAYPRRRGRGSVDVAALHTGSGSSRVLTSSEKTEVYDYIEARRPTGATVRVLDVTIEATDVEILVQPTGADYEFDWDDATPLTVSSYTSGTRTLVFTTDRPAGMDAGDRLIWSTGDGEQYVIESLSSTDAVVLELDPSVAPSGTVYAGGPLVDPVRDLVLAHINLLGTANIDAEYGSWEGSLRPSTLFKLAQLTTGVLDSEVPTPAAVVDPSDPAYPDDDEIGLITPGNIIVRRRH